MGAITWNGWMHGISPLTEWNRGLLMILFLSTATGLGYLAMRWSSVLLAAPIQRGSTALAL